MRSFLVALLFLPLGAVAWPLSESEVNAIAPGCLCSANDPNFKGLRWPMQIPSCSRNVSTSTKKQIKKIFGIAPSKWGQYEVDHRISLWAGGSNDRCNLVPIERVKHADKNVMEEQLRSRVIEDTITYEEVILSFNTWYHDCFFNNVCMSKVATSALFTPASSR